MCFRQKGLRIDWNGSKFVAVGDGTNTIAYSIDGITWRGLGTSTFNLLGLGISYNYLRPHTVTYPKNMTIAAGLDATTSGSTSLAYSYDNGITWTAVSPSPFAVAARDVVWNGRVWVAVGEGITSAIFNTIAWSYDGINWNGLGDRIFNTAGHAVKWNGIMFVAFGTFNLATSYGQNTIAYSYDGMNWIPVVNNTSIFSIAGWGAYWNGITCGCPWRRNKHTCLFNRWNQLDWQRHIHIFSKRTSDLLEWHPMGCSW